jgi:putative FmdB family regulatory protein
LDGRHRHTAELALETRECQPQQEENAVPTYQYACTACGHELEAVQSFTDAALTQCPECGGALRKVFSAVGVVFKGSGFYKTDSRSKSTSATTTSSESKPAAKTETSSTSSSSSSTSTPAASSTPS